jgi:ATP-dependent protease HslVU (ClpYQ) peptidase subunit
MTCIVGVEHDGNIYIGGDSAGVAGMQLQTRSDEKVFVANDFIMGFTTSFRMGQLLRYAFTPPEHSPKKDDMTYLVTDFVNSIRDCYRDNGYLTREAEVESGGTFLFGYRNNLYSMEDDFQIAKSQANFAACGCGSQIALGAMAASRTLTIAPEKRIELALLAAEEFSAGVRGPYTILVLPKL